MSNHLNAEIDIRTQNSSNSFFTPASTTRARKAYKSICRVSLRLSAAIRCPSLRSVCQ